MRIFLTAAAALLLTSGLAVAGEKGMMHCFAFTVIPEATDSDWKAFAEATDQWPQKFKGIQKVWHGKLRAPLAQFTVSAEARKKLAAGEKDVDTKANRLMRQHGVCMLMENADTLKAYTAQPFHKEWMAKYEKVRVAGTTTYDILGQ
ncbi:MAG TPA: hypothetical protein VFQ91_07115 [Bryobacteraceae bacterium]|nr:hypothetical protein [Bryobacteraceae bacterium]